jgi:hypothetical protein
MVLAVTLPPKIRFRKKRKRKENKNKLKIKERLVSSLGL